MGLDDIAPPLETQNSYQIFALVSASQAGCTQATFLGA
jgi:hypothetical protein